MAYLTVDQVKARIGAKAQNWDDDKVERFVQRFEEVAESYLGHAYWTLDDDDEYQPRERTVSVRSRGCDSVLILPDMYVQEITALTLDDAEWTEDQIGDLDLDGDTGVVHGWGRYGVVAVTYTYGKSAPPPAVLDACAFYVKARGFEDATDRNPAMEAYEDNSGYSYTIGRADPANGRPTGLVVVDDALNEVVSSRAPAVG